MNAIVVVDRNWGIGKDGGLLAHLPGDLRYYRQKTLGNVTIVGRKTLESFPEGKPLPDRVNIVLTRNTDYMREDCIVCNSVEQVLEELERYDRNRVFVSGGAEVYGQFMELCDSFYVTRIYENFDADRYFPDLDALGFEVVWESPLQEENGMYYRFLKYSRPQKGLPR